MQLTVVKPKDPVRTSRELEVVRDEHDGERPLIAEPEK
jgi:hypothetical protein